MTLVPRVARDAIELHGQTIPAGAVVQLALVSANRDPEHFPDPDRFSVARDPRGVLSFGHGPHGCLGARLARERSAIALRELFDRLGEVRLLPDVPIRWYRNAGNRGPEELHITWA